jgi:hypothetical protein
MSLPVRAASGDSGFAKRNNVLTRKDRAVFVKLTLIAQQRPGNGGRNAATFGRYG